MVSTEKCTMWVFPQNPDYGYERFQEMPVRPSGKGRYIFPNVRLNDK